MENKPLVQPRSPNNRAEIKRASARGCLALQLGKLHRAPMSCQIYFLFNVCLMHAGKGFPILHNKTHITEKKRPSFTMTDALKM